MFMGRMWIYLANKLLERLKREHAEEMLRVFFEQAKVTITPPVDVFALATNLGFDVRGAFFPDSEVDGLIIADENSDAIDGFNSNKIIVYNNVRLAEEQRFIVAHELSHFIKEKSMNPNAKLVYATRDHKAKNYSMDEEEQFIDYMAAAILIPKNDIIKQFASKYDVTLPLTFKLCKEVADTYKVMDRLAERRLEEVFSG